MRFLAESSFDTLAEWSKASGRGPGLFGGAGSNPAGIISFVFFFEVWS